MESGEIGDPLLIRLTVISGRSVGGWEIPEATMEWRGDPARGGGSMFFFDHGAHMAATAVHFMGPVATVHAMTVGTEDTGSLIPGTPANITFRCVDERRLGTWTGVGSRDIPITTDYYPVDELVEITGEKGIVWINQTSSRLLGGPPVSLHRDGKMRHFSDMNTDWGDSFKLAGRQFTDAIANGTSIGLDGATARHNLAFQLAAIKSNDEHREIAVADMG